MINYKKKPKTLYNIEVNPALLWDHEFQPHQLRDEEFFIWYLGRLLEKGTAAEVKKIPLKVIGQYLDRLKISRRVRRFWQWYLHEMQVL
ncbi:MAG: hypothetical protein Q9P14_14880 [candidate division KSB1 bacterium]|nr:hypothetical protein [candidate division KSB1 bacterium]MDQ7064194.1 hypothetical protein [candidate division KSB1 bacterium]